MTTPEGARPADAGDRRGALTDLRVIDLSRVVAGPLCCQTLADHGADVIKVEPPGGDETRGWGPPFTDDGHSAYFDGLHRNKRNIVLDLKTDQGRAVLRALLASADVLVENFTAGTLERWGLGDDVLRSEFPGLVHCRITGYGEDGPLGAAPGYDAVMQALSGLMSVNGVAEGPPLRVGIPLVDIITGINAVGAIMMALHARGVTGRGQTIDMALLDNAVSVLHPHAGTWFATGRAPGRSGSAHPTISPYETFDCADGPVFIGAGNDRQFRSLVSALRLPELGDDPRYVTNADRLQNSADLRRSIAGALCGRPRAEVVDLLRAVSVPSGAVHDVGQALQDPQVRHRGMVVEVDGYRGVGIPGKLTSTPGAVRHGPRAAGAEADGVLTEIGLTAVEIAELRAAGVLGRRRPGS